MGRYNDWGKYEQSASNSRYSPYDESQSRRSRGGFRGGGGGSRGRGGNSYGGGGGGNSYSGYSTSGYSTGGHEEYRREGGGGGGYRGRGGGGESSRGSYRGRYEEYDRSSSGYRGGRGGRPSPRYGSDRGSRGGSGGYREGGGGGGYRGSGRGRGGGGGYRESDKGGYYGRESSYSSYREDRGESRYEQRSGREDSYSSRDSGWRSGGGEGRGRYDSTNKRVAMDIVKAVLSTIEGGSRSSRSSRPPRRGGRSLGPRERRDYGDRSSRRHEPYRNERTSYSTGVKSRKRTAMEDVEDTTAGEEIEPELLHCFLCDWLKFDSKEEFLEHVSGRNHRMKLKAYHDVNDSVLEILRSNAQLIAMEEIHEKELKDKFSECDRCQCKIHESQKKSHTEGKEHQQVKKFLNVNCCEKLNLYMDRRGWHQLSHHLLTIGHLKKIGNSKFLKKEEDKENEEETKQTEKEKENEDNTEKNTEEEQSAINGAEKEPKDGEAEDTQPAPISDKQPSEDSKKDSDEQSRVNDDQSEKSDERKQNQSSSDSMKESNTADKEHKETEQNQENVSVKSKDSKKEDDTVHFVDCIKKMFALTGKPFQVYSPTISMGMEEMFQAVKFTCRICSVKIESTAQSIKEHCSSKEHYEKFKKHLDRSRKLKESQEDDNDNADMFDDMANLETVDEAVEDDDDAPVEEEEEEMDFSQEEIDTIGEQIDTMFEAVDETPQEEEEQEEEGENDNAMKNDE